MGFASANSAFSANSKSFENEAISISPFNNDIWRDGSSEEIVELEELGWRLKYGLVKGFNKPEGLCLTSKGWSGQDISSSDSTESTVSIFGVVAGVGSEEDGLWITGGGEGGTEETDSWAGIGGEESGEGLSEGGAVGMELETSEVM